MKEKNYRFLENYINKKNQNKVIIKTNKIHYNGF